MKYQIGDMLINPNTQEIIKIVDILIEVHSRKYEYIIDVVYSKSNCENKYKGIISASVIDRQYRELNDIEKVLYNN